ncbi:hypothetical protein BRD00_07580 [Halobacteriales archaeon QS_8_69_26]|nr:MAG: hypothetical protein BRD00_07580 [Halobacteriales archaeon QS_8_69_26]
MSDVSSSGDGGREVDLPVGIGRHTSTLLVGDAYDRTVRDVCNSLLNLEDDRPVRVVPVTFHHSSAEVVERWRAVNGPLPEEMVVIVVSESQTWSSGRDGSLHDNVDVGYASPTDITGLGINIQRALTQDRTRTVVCFDDLTNLLMYVDDQIVFRFIRALGGNILAADGTIHYHLDPSAHDRQVRNTFRTAVDAVVEIDDDGEVKLLER